MAGRVILATAGAGKTYYIASCIDEQTKNLIITFTHENIRNIRKEVIKRFKRIPEKTFIMTFHSFLHQFLMLPYEKTIFSLFNKPWRKTEGVTLNTPPAPSFVKEGKRIPNPYYHTNKELEHYINEKNEYYCTLMSYLLIRHLGMGKNKEKLTAILRNVSRFLTQSILMSFRISGKKIMSC